MIPKVLTIAGSDSSGGAGIQADLKTFSALGCYGMSVITALTAQNTQGVQGVHPVPAEFLEQQLRSIFEDIPPAAVKIGMVGDMHSIHTLAAVLNKYDAQNIILDPVMVSTSGDQLVSGDSVDAIRDYLMPMATVITPNKQEVKFLGAENGRGLVKMGARAVLVTGGHSTDPTCIDLLVSDTGAKGFEGRRFNTPNTHGTGCTLSAAIAAGMAKGLSLQKSISEAKTYINGALRHADELDVGEGPGPVHHFWEMWVDESEDEAQGDTSNQ